MQSSLLRFLVRREKEVASREKRPADSGASGCEVAAKKPKLAGQSSSLRKLKQFERPKEVCRSSTNSTHQQDVCVTEQPATATKSIVSAEGTLKETEPELLFVEETRCDSNRGSKTGSHSSEAFASTSHSHVSKSRSTSRSHSSLLTSSDSKAHSRFQSKAKTANAQGSTSTTSSRSSAATGPPGSSKQYTPLEQQVVAIKAQYPDAVLFVECGYKYRFFGEDAEIASKVLRIGCFPDHNFMTASIPTHRLHVHLRRLVATGYKVGVVKQTETAALKAASDKKSGPFSRELTALYTRTTLLGPDVQGGGGGGGEEGGGGCGVEEEEEGLYLMCLCEGRPVKRKGKEKETTIGFLAVQPSAGNMVYDEFTDLASSFSELEMRLSHLHPAEVLYPQGGSGALEGALREWRRYCGIPGLRFERLPEEWFDYCKAFQTVSSFYDRSNTAPTTGSEASSKQEDSAALQTVINLPATALCCLGALVHHLKVFRLQRVLALTSNLQPFSTGGHFMRLNSKALEGLEIFRNLTDRRERGSLFWVLNHTLTPFGRRLLGRWISYPLRNITKLLARQEAVRELSCSESPCLSFARGTLSRLPDLEKMLCSSYHRRCSPAEFYSMVKSLVRMQTEMQAYTDLALSDFKADLLQQVFKEVPLLLKEVQEILESLKEPAAKEVVYEDLFVKLENFPGILQEKKAIADVEQKLMDFRKEFRKTVGYPSANYVTVSGVQYLVEVKNKDVERVPSDWTRVSGTKLVSRFHPPYVLEAVKCLALHTEQLRINARKAWGDFLGDFSCHYGSYKRAIELLASLDCLLSLAKVAKMPGYVCPALVEEPVIHITSGRHPVIDQLLGGGEQYVPNDTEISTSGLRAMIITGPNMGGKSSYIKQVALMCVMAQVGSYIPATSATLGILDAVYLRMGATDNIYTGKSTFMVELMEASEVMRLATPKSLVILDELGRGTSTHDGTAVAYATLTHFIEEVKCLTLFVTHYPLLAELEDQHPEAVGNFHMAYVEADTSEDYERIVFLYQLEKGRAGGSYGLNVAALAGLEKDLLRVARRKSQQLKQATLERPSEVEGISESSRQSFRKTLQLMQPDYSPRLLLEFLNAAVQL